MPTAPGVVCDGDWTIAKQDGATSFEFPFSESRNDFATFIARRKMTVEVNSYRPPIPMTQKSFPRLGTGYLVGITNPTIVEGHDLLAYYEIYANVPKRHVEPGQASATIQQLVTVEPDEGEPYTFPIDKTDTFDADYEYDYAIDLNKIPKIFKSELKIYPYGIRDALQYGLDIKKPPRDGRYLANNSVTERWMGGIFCRTTIYVKPPPIKKWNGVVT